MFEYKVGDITYRRYNKKYMTPAIFNAYKIYALTIMAGIISLVFVLGFHDLYIEHVGIDIVFSLSFLLMSTLIKSMYTNGLFNRCVDHEGVAYKIAAAYALFTQVAFWRTIISLPLIVITSGFDAITFSTSTFIAIGIVIAAYMVTFGVFSRYKYHNRMAQKTFSAVIDGPISMKENCDAILEKNMVEISKLEHSEMATSEFFGCQSKFYESARNVKSVSNDYDKKWRTYLACGNFQYTNCFPEHTPLYLALESASTKHKKNAVALNKVVNKINKQPYTAPLKIAEQKKNKKITISRIPQENVIESTKPIKEHVEEKTRKSFWDKDVNWY